MKQLLLLTLIISACSETASHVKSEEDSSLQQKMPEGQKVECGVSAEQSQLTSGTFYDSVRWQSPKNSVRELKALAVSSFAMTGKSIALNDDSDHSEGFFVRCFTRDGFVVADRYWGYDKLANLQSVYKVETPINLMSLYVLDSELKASNPKHTTLITREVVLIQIEDLQARLGGYQQQK